MCIVQSLSAREEVKLLFGHLQCPFEFGFLYPGASSQVPQPTCFWTSQSQARTLSRGFPYFCSMRWKSTFQNASKAKRWRSREENLAFNFLSFLLSALTSELLKVLLMIHCVLGLYNQYSSFINQREDCTWSFYIYLESIGHNHLWWSKVAKCH